MTELEKIDKAIALLKSTKPTYEEKIKKAANRAKLIEAFEESNYSETGLYDESDNNSLFGYIAFLEEEYYSLMAGYHCEEPECSSLLSLVSFLEGKIYELSSLD